jgi:hypothetical protein
MFYSDTIFHSASFGHHVSFGYRYLIARGNRAQAIFGGARLHAARWLGGGHRHDFSANNNNSSNDACAGRILGAFWPHAKRAAWVPCSNGFLFFYFFSRFFLQAMNAAHDADFSCWLPPCVPAGVDVLIWSLAAPNTIAQLLEGYLAVDCDSDPFIVWAEQVSLSAIPAILRDIKFRNRLVIVEFLDVEGERLELSFKFRGRWLRYIVLCQDQNRFFHNCDMWAEVLRLHLQWQVYFFLKIFINWALEQAEVRHTGQKSLCLPPFGPPQYAHTVTFDFESSSLIILIRNQKKKFPGFFQSELSDFLTLCIVSVFSLQSQRMYAMRKGRIEGLMWESMRGRENGRWGWFVPAQRLLGLLAAIG